MASGNLALQRAAELSPQLVMFNSFDLLGLRHQEIDPTGGQPAVGGVPFSSNARAAGRVVNLATKTLLNRPVV